MTRLITMLFAGSALLAVFCVSQMQFFGFALDYFFSWVVPGSALFGIACALSLHGRRGAHATDSRRDGAAMRLLVSTAPAAVLSQFALLYLPLGPVPVFLVLVAIAALPYLAWMYGVLKSMVDVEGAYIAAMLATVGGIVTGLLLSGVVLDYAGGPVRAGWLICAALGVVPLLGASRRSLVFALIIAGAAAGLAAQQLNVTQYAMPRWQPGSPYVVKPILGALAAGRNMTSHPVGWDAEARTDVLVNADRRGGYDWLLTDGTAPVPVIQNEQSVPWLLERFPIAAIPLLAGDAGSILSLSPVPGPEVALAQRLSKQIPAGAGANNDAVNIAYAGHGLPETPQAISHALMAVNDRYDLVFLPVTHPVVAGWAGSSADAAGLYTQEAIRSYWDRLNEGGMLAVTTRDEMLFVRMLLTVWDMLPGSEAKTGKELVQQVWGVRLVPLASFKGSYQYLLLAQKGGTRTAATPEKLRSAIEGMPVEVLFGRGFSAVQTYRLIEASDSSSNAARKFTGIFSRSIQKRMDFRSATFQRPFFFHLVRDAHPYMKWLLTACLAILVPVLLFPVAPLRRPAGQESCASPPLPVILGYCALPGGVVVMAVLSVTQQLGLWSTAMDVAALIPVVALLSGLVVGWSTCRQIAASSRAGMLWAPLLVIFALLPGWWLAGHPAESGVSGAAELRLFLLAVVFLLAGAGAALAQRAGLRYMNTADLVGLVPWAWLVCGIVMLAATVLVYWFAILWGWDGVWTGAAAGSVLAAGAGWWMSRWQKCPSDSVNVQGTQQLR